MEPSNDTATDIATSHAEPGDSTGGDVGRSHVASVQDASKSLGRAAGSTGARVLARLNDTGAVLISKDATAAEPVAEL